MDWINARTRDSSLGIPPNTKILVRLSKVKHTSIGKCWWVYDGVNFRQVAETFGGKNLCKSVKLGKVFSQQDKITAKFQEFAKKYKKLLKTP